MMIITGSIKGERMSVQFVSHKIERRVSDNEIVVISESSSTSLEEKVTDLAPHHRDSLSGSTSSKGKDPDVSETTRSDDVVIEIGSAAPAKPLKVLEPKSDDYDILRIYGSDPAKWWPPKSQREINDLTRTPAHMAQHRKARIGQYLAVGGVITSGVATCIAVYHAIVESTSVWVPVGWSLAAAATATAGVFLLCYALRSQGVMRHTESNLR
jgi:hypothetical protein